MGFNGSVVTNGSAEASLIIFKRAAYQPVFILGLLLNASALWRFKRAPQWTDTHIYMLNLLLADLLLTLFLPFRIFDTYIPINLKILCTFLKYVHYSNRYTSIFTITVISIHRYVVVKFPMQNQASVTSEARRKKTASGICAFIWLIVIALCITFHHDMQPETLKTCYERKDDFKISLQFLLTLEILGYLLPIVIVTTCSTQAIRTVQKSIKAIRQYTHDNITDESKRIVAIVTANMLVFIVCFTPIHVGYLLRYISEENTRFVHIFYEVSEWIATTNCFLDSVGYYFLLNKNIFGSKR